MATEELWHKYRAPRETLLTLGAKALSDIELLAIFLRTGVAGMNVMELSHQLLSRFGSLHQLMSANYECFCQQKGLGMAKFVQLQAAIELAHRYFSAEIFREYAIYNPQSTIYYLQQLISQQEREIFIVIFLDNKHRVIKSSEMFLGSITCVEVYPREILKEALKVNSAALILAHNHPSGDATPSKEDQMMTEKISNICQLVDISVLDHLVIAHGQYFSFAEEGLL